MKVLDAVVLLLPLLFTLLALRAAPVGPAQWILGAYVYPIVAVLMVASPGYVIPSLEMSESTGNVLRAGVHVANLWGLGLAMLWRGRLTVSNASLLAVALTAAGLMATSVLLVGSESALIPGILRAGLLVILAINLLLFLPTVVGDRGGEFLETFSRGLFGLMLGVVAVALYVRLVYGPYPEWSPRFGRPLNPRVLSQLLLITAILMTVTTGRLRHGLLLAIPLLATGSRLSISLMVLFGVIHFWKRRRRASVILLLGGGVALAAAVVTVVVAGVFSRSGLFAGRLLLWGTALARVPDVWAWGTGERFFLPVESDDPLLAVSRLHNGPLEAILSHGVWFAGAAVFLYALFALRFVGKAAGPATGTRRTPPEIARLAGSSLLVVAALEAVVGTSFWTNLGDTFSLIVLTVLSVCALCLRRELQRRPSAWQPAEVP